jgi:DNA invertase Pin-like site-specific DNA recombinase
MTCHPTKPTIKVGTIHQRLVLQRRSPFAAGGYPMAARRTSAVWKVDRLGRSTIDALQTAERLTKAGVRTTVTTLGVDLHTPAGRLVFGVLSQIAEFEREQILERVNDGIAAARARKKAIGRPRSRNAHQRREAARLIDEGSSYGKVAALFGTSRSVIWDTVAKLRAAAPVNGVSGEAA